VLVTGDGDFTTVIQDLKRNEKHVICMGMEANCSPILKNCCDEFIKWTPESTSTVTIQTQPIQQAIEDKFKSSDNVELNCGQLKEQLLRINPSFTECNYDQPSFSALLRSLGYNVIYNSGGTPFCKKK